MMVNHSGISAPVMSSDEASLDVEPRKGGPREVRAA